MKDKELFMIGLFGRLQIELMELGGVIDSNNGGISKKPRRVYPDGTWRKLKLEELTAIDIYKWTIEQIGKEISEEELNKKARYTNEVASKIINDEKTVNNFLLATYMLEMYIDENENTLLKNMMLPKTNRLIDHYYKHIGEENMGIMRTTYRVADNMYRVFTEKPQISDQERNLKFKRKIHVQQSYFGR